MKDYYNKNYFKNKKVTVMGLGLLGRAVGDARFLAEEGADLIITDLKTEEELKSSVDQLRDFPNIKFVLGEHRLEDFSDRDFVLKAAGVPLDNKYINHALENDIPVEMSTSLFCSLLPDNVTTIGVTGTRGKSTVTHMIYEVLKESIKDKKVHLGLNRKDSVDRTTFKPKVVLGGNVRGLSTLAKLPEIKEGDFVVMELDSWQLQGFGTKGISPNIAVFTTMMRDHMNYYKDNMDLYVADKANIFINQNKDDIFVIGKQALKEVQPRYKDDANRATVVDIIDEIRSWNINFPGEHNLYNASIAVTVLQNMKIEINTIKETFKNLKPVEGRIQFVKDIDGVMVYNDNNATTPEATMAGIDAVKDKGDVVLIMGGADKGLSLDRLIEKLATNVRKVILLPGTGTDRLVQQGLREKGVKYFHAFNLPDAVKQAGKVIKRGDVLLFSPAFASFGEFNNEYERNDLFLSEIDKLR